MVSSSGPSSKAQRSVSSSDDDFSSSSIALGTPSRRRAVERFQLGLMTGDTKPCIAGLRNDLGLLSWSGSPFEWLKEPLAIGFTPEEVVDSLLEERRHSPQIPYKSPGRAMPQMDPDFHQAGCVHQSVQHESRSIKSLSSEAKRMIAEHCGLGGIIPEPWHFEALIRRVKFEDSTAWINFGAPDEDEQIDQEVAYGALFECQEALGRMTNLCGWLQREGSVCNQIVVIRYDDRFRSAAIPLWLIAQLQECVDEAITRRPPQHEDERNCRMFDTALQLLWTDPPSSLLKGHRLVNAVDLCAWAVQMISVSLLPLCEAHIRALHPCFLDRPVNTICLSGVDGPMSKELKFGFHLEGLACVGLMLGSPIMTFASGQPSPVEESSRNTLDTSVEHSLELWGPGCAIWGASTSAHAVQAIEIGEGFIYQPLEGSILHWAPGDWALELCDDDILNEYFDISGPLSIGGLFSINQSCPSPSQHNLVNGSVIHQEIHTLGTQQASWKLQQMQAGLQAGQIANVTFNGTWVKSACRTKKEQALAEMGSDVLDQPWGLLVSLCTGIARRVPLHEVIAEVTHHIILAWLEDPDKFNGPSIWEVCDEMRKSSFRYWLCSQSSHHHQVIGRRIMHVLGKLCWTGVSSNLKLVTACPSEKQADGCIHISLDNSPFLATILQDTERSATFASLTTQCFVANQHRCQSNCHPEWGNKVTALATSVCHHRYTGGGNWVKMRIKGLEHGRLYWMGHMNENRRLVADLSGGQGHGVVLKVVDSQAPWSFYLQAYERIERMRARYIALREAHYLGEKGAEEVLIVSR